MVKRHLTLREAIMLSEGSLAYDDLTDDEKAQVSPSVGNEESDTINFSFSGTIFPASALPEITDDGTVIDASSRWSGVWPSGQPTVEPICPPEIGNSCPISFALSGQRAPDFLT